MSGSGYHSETEGEDEEPDAVEDTGESGETAPVPSVEKAILELTKIAGLSAVVAKQQHSSALPDSLHLLNCLLSQILRLAELANCPSSLWPP